MDNYLRFYNGLNDEQKLAVDSVEGPLLVLAGPGTGKTQLLSVRAGSILNKTGARPENILILTYTNSAAKAMKERLAKIVGLAGYDIEVNTFHGFANSVIQESAEAANYIGDKIQMDDVERMRVVEYILDHIEGLDEIRPFRSPYMYLKEVLERISDLKKDGITPADFEKYLKDPAAGHSDMEEKYKKRLRALAIVYRYYEELKEGRNKEVFDERGRYDFDDMILFATEAIRKEADLKHEYQKQYIYVMVDEYQDTNGSQIEFLFTLLDYKSPNLACVGDDDQSIYRFQGASVGNFKLLSRRFPGLKTLSLKDNYRSSKELIEISSKIIGRIPIKERMGEKGLKPMRNYKHKEILFREFTTEEEELIYIVDKVRELKKKIEKGPDLTKEERSHPYNNIAVLLRKRSDILKIINAFLQAGIPYATDGKEDISGEKRVKQLLDILELAHIDPEDDPEVKGLALYKVLTSDYFHISHVDILRFISFANSKRSRNSEKTSLLEEFLKCFSSNKKGINFDDENRMRKVSQIINKLLEDARTRPLHTILMDFIKEAGIFKYLLKEYADNEILRIREIRALSSFVNMVKASDKANPAIRLDDFMSEMKTRKDHGLPIQGNLVTLQQAGVRIYTAHGAKGLEFHSVILPFCLQNKNWPARPIPDRIQMPPDLFKTSQRVTDKEALRELALQDETRLFYVAMTRSKSNLIFTASPTENIISSFYLTNLGIEKGVVSDIEEEEVAFKSVDMTELQDPFIGTEAVLKDMVSNLSLNPTRLNNYITCHRKFLYNDVLKLPGSKKLSLVFGNCAHKALEETYKAYMEKGQFPAFRLFQDSFIRELKYQGVDKAIERDCINNIKKIKSWFDLTSKNPVIPIDLERKITVTIGDNIIFTGKYDKLEWEDEKKGLVRIVDYKTGKPDKHLKKIQECDDLSSRECDDYLRQLVCYKLLFDKDRKMGEGRRAAKGVLVFVADPVSANFTKQGYRKGDYVAKSMEISDEMVSSMEEIIKDAWAGITRLRFEKLKERDSDICGRCDFDALCWQ